MLTAIVGVNWGDEGKGRMVDMLSESFDVVCRYQGGNNAGHTVVNEKGKFILNLLPSGVLRETTVNVMGPGMVIDLRHLRDEVGRVAAGGVKITPDNLLISDKAVICLPFHPVQDVLEEERLGDRRYGSTRRGIAPVYSDKYMKKALRMGDLFSGNLATRVYDICEWKNLTLTGGYGAQPVDPGDVAAWLTEFGDWAKPFVADVSDYLYYAARDKKNILFEAQLGALRDIDYGIYPYTSSSTTLAAYAPIGAGAPGLKLDSVIGVVKAYSSAVGEGPFTAEMFGPEADRLREAGAEYGAATSRPRRVGPFDAVASRYGAQVQGADALALTKLDVLGYMDRIPIVTAYDIDGERTRDFPSGDALERAVPVVEYVEGFAEDVSKCRSVRDLPVAARNYVSRIESECGVPVKYISVGADRGACVVL
ncbi:MAG: adenylosuccinate synthase [Clostridiales bacterium]|jgi:adenylosuccinate synthase|nr:adenylosuccinate synthase [Clostridiales bacterium]